MRQPKQVILGFRATSEQAAKVAGIADRAGVNTSELLRLLVDNVQDVKKEVWSIVWAGQEQKEAVQR